MTRQQQVRYSTAGVIFRSVMFTFFFWIVNSIMGLFGLHPLYLQYRGFYLGVFIGVAMFRLAEAFAIRRKGGKVTL